jgi:Zn-dependent peptidase ImmA (M78 family)
MLGKLSGEARRFEKSALRIRKFAGLSSFCARLEPYNLAARLGMRVIEMKDLPNVSDQTARTLLLDKSGEWSGASSGKLPDGSVLIVLNTTQSYLRRKATLMEEVCHVLLGHQRNRLSSDLFGSRDYNKKDEAEAYAVGAAALVPFAGLWHFLEQGLQSLEIARHYDVTKSLVEYRMQVTELRLRNT